MYAAFGSHCDRPPYYPWLFAFDAKTLAISSFWTTPVLICACAQGACALPVWLGARTPSAAHAWDIYSCARLPTVGRGTDLFPSSSSAVG